VLDPEAWVRRCERLALEHDVFDESRTLPTECVKEMLWRTGLSSQSASCKCKHSELQKCSSPRA
jgi:hypothetical protein